MDRYVRHRLAEGKRRSSYYLLEGHWIAAFRDLRLASLTSDQIQDALEAATESAGLSPATRVLALNQLSGLFTYARRRFWVRENPVALVPRPRVDNTRRRWLTIEELNRVLAHSPVWLKPTIRFAVKTGMRLGEIVELKGGSVFVYPDGRALIETATTTKNGERLRWPLEGSLREEVLTRARDVGPNGYLFPGPLGGHPRMSVIRHFKQAVLAAGLRWGRSRDGITFHSLRHSMASLALNSGVPERLVQEMGNWKDPRMVRRYGHLSAENFRLAAAHLSDLVDGK